MSVSESNSPRVVVTGIGLLSPLGNTLDAFWDHLIHYRSGVRVMENLLHTSAPHNVGGEVRNVDDKTARSQYFSEYKELKKTVKVMCREIMIGVSSATLAVGDAGLDLEKVALERMGVDFGANLMFSPPDVLRDACWSCADDKAFQYDKWGGTGMKNLEPLWLLKYLPNMPACHIAIAFDARGPSNSLTMDDASGNIALGEAFRIITRGAADIMIAGTTGTRVHSVKTMHATLWDQMAENDGPPETWCRPFDKNRNGQVVAEGACTFILETEEHARGRGAKIYGELLGVGSSCVLAKDGKAEPTQALVNAMTAALRDAGLQPADIGHINAHGLGSVAADLAEARAIHQVFGPLGRKVPVTALKSYLGNAGSGAGTLELAGSLIALQHGIIPATLNYQTPDPECGLNVVHGDHQPTANKVVLNINVTRMGQASALIARGL